MIRRTDISKRIVAKKSPSDLFAVSEKKSPQKRIKAKAFFLGVGIDAEKAPVMHDPNFDIDSILELERREYQQFLKAEMVHKKRLEKMVFELEMEKRRQMQLQRERENERLRVENERRMKLEAELVKKAEQIRLMTAERTQDAARFSNNISQLLDQQEVGRREMQREREEEERRWEAAARSYQSNGGVKKNPTPIHFFNEESSEDRLHKEILHIKQERRTSVHAKKEGKKKYFPQKKRAYFFDNDPVAEFSPKKLVSSFAMASVIMSLVIGGSVYFFKGMGAKGRVLGVSRDGYGSLASAVKEMSQQNFTKSAEDFDVAIADFSKASDDINDLGGSLLNATRYFPFISKVSSGKNAIEAGKHFSAAGKYLNNIARMASDMKKSQNDGTLANVSLLDLLKNMADDLGKAKMELDQARKNIDYISIDDLPEDKREKFLLVKEELPKMNSLVGSFLDNSGLLADLLGGNGPRKYLFLFQNNAEMRATGGFIGTYALLDISNGHVKKFFIDGIFNPDGQLSERIMPPIPIQKISTNWSLHDSNWFPNFPDSAQKAIWFYEKTGGPTVDGVITVTPTVMQKLLGITGPIDMPDYGVTLDANNFIELTQYKVEEDYDKIENRPKKILSDLAPLVLEKLLSGNDPRAYAKTMGAFLEGLSEKHILLYSQNDAIEQIISAQGWSGEILSSDRDFLSVINTNINGFKTDAVVDESIEHRAEIQDDGSVVDTVRITRKHTGGNSEYDWFNKVNADYMRVYVPKGSKLLEISGQTKEKDASPVDYAALGFKKDDDVEKEKNSIVIDDNSGTRVYEQNDKTVFANWTYVSPGETMTIEYKYLLPFRLFQVTVGSGEQADAYSLIVQKQPGSIGSNFSSEVAYPPSYSLKWFYPESDAIGNDVKNAFQLKTDHFIGCVFSKSVSLPKR